MQYEAEAKLMKSAAKFREKNRIINQRFSITLAVVKDFVRMMNDTDYFSICSAC